MRKHSDEVVERKSRGIIGFPLIKYPVKFFQHALFYGGPALPTSTLNSLRPLIHGGQLNTLNSPKAVGHLLTHSNPTALLLAGLLFAGSESTFYFLNKKYINYSAKAVYDLIIRNINFLRGKREGSLQNLLADNFLAVWAFYTSLIFAEIGGAAFGTIGPAGYYVGFSVSLLVYFGSRFGSMMGEKAKRSDPNYRAKERYLAILDVLENNPNLSHAATTQANVNNDDEGDFKHYKVFLTKVDSLWSEQSIFTIRNFLFNPKYGLTRLIGWGMMTLTVTATYFSVLASGVKGFDALTRSSIDKANKYHGAYSFILGTALAIPTLIFYGISALNSPRRIFRAIGFFIKFLRTQDYPSAIKIALVGALVSAASFCASYGFELIPERDISSGYMDYLPSSFVTLLPGAFVFSVMNVLLEHLVELMNKWLIAGKAKARPNATLNVEEQAKKVLDVYQLRDWLNKPDTKIVVSNTTSLLLPSSSSHT